MIEKYIDGKKLERGQKFKYYKGDIYVLIGITKYRPLGLENPHDEQTIVVFETPYGLISTRYSELDGNSDTVLIGAYSSNPRRVKQFVMID